MSGNGETNTHPKLVPKPALIILLSILLYIYDNLEYYIFANVLIL